MASLLDSSIHAHTLIPESGRSVKILVVGDSEVGKTSLVHLLCHKVPLSRPLYTTGCSLEVKVHEHFSDKTDVSSRELFYLEFWDIGGSIAYEKSRYLFYDSADGIVLVHDLTNRNSHDNLRKWLKGVLTDRNKVQGKKGHKYTNSDDYGKGFDAEIYTNSAMPAIIIGTKKDLSRSSNELISHSSLATDINAQVIAVNCRKASDFTPGAPEMQCLNAFFDKVICQKYYSQTSLPREEEISDLGSSRRGSWLRQFTQSLNSSFST
ncbi:Rab-like protein 3 [Oopsacas minuta]|uniref:Rab-like protein 3 n=1 Tax=Oopsacas minuta TaxID=111878 RepID=A0AAV7JP66_9METZ|nr:Rab-like protein 3 [Oopsacas minuta]